MANPRRFSLVNLFPPKNKPLMCAQKIIIYYYSPGENCLVDLKRDTRTSTQSRRLVRRKGASWSLHWASGANLLAHVQLKCILHVPLLLLCTCLSLFLGEY